MKCVICGKTFEPGNDEAGIPNGLGFIGKDGKQVDICAECVSKAPEDPTIIEKMKKELGQAW